MIAKYFQVGFSLWLTVMVIYTPIYVFFMDSIDSAVKSISIEDMLKEQVEKAYMLVPDDEIRKHSLEVVKTLVKKFKKELDIDLSDSIYDVIKKSKKNKNIEILKSEPLQIGAIPNGPKELREGATMYGVKIAYTTPKGPRAIPFFAIDASYVRAHGARVYFGGDTKELRELASLYGFPQKEEGGFIHFYENLLGGLPDIYR